MDTADAPAQSSSDQDDRLKQLFSWITSIPGIGPATATELLVATDEFIAIHDPKKLA